MLTLRDPLDVARVDDEAIRSLLARRFIDLCQGEDYSPDDHGEFFLLQPGDTIEAVESAAAVWITAGFIHPARYGDPGFVPCFEVLEEHPCCFELVFILNGCGSFRPRFRGPQPADFDSLFVRG